MKVLVIAERTDAARELCAGARTMADEVVLVSFGEAPEAVADKIARISVPEGTVLDDAADTVISVFDAEAPAVVLVEPTRHMKTIAGKLAAHANASVITDVMSFENGAVSLYFGGVAER
ncbi:electron transfer flavoprotein subunit alpha/FixB family protein, partial [Eggerthella lenta]|nr:electron transfer flavoprotein subunit alpha/FixB family protein [Eggerthella lenta]MVN46998.1 electron transfer flavoprotein subunit alpha/FixB family protein [Eggerthella lenta]MVN52267.1 electron transfer flavoprotein subunit alpha/FixB family protein [Eggerthella lenta]